ncbi:MAG: PhoH family protein [Actinomycetota bacterium]
MIEIQRLAESLPAGGIAPLSVSISGVDGIEETSHLYHAGETDTLRVWTQLGFSIEATPEHPLLALAENGELVWRRADQLQPGDTLALQRGQRLFGRRTSIDFQYVRSGHDNTSKPVVLEELDLDLAYVMGVLTGDGCLSFGNRVILSTADPELAEAFERIAARFGLHVFPNGRGRPYDHIIQSAQLKALFAHLGMSTGTARTKVIPRSILEAPEAIVAAFLRGLFDADGSVEARDGRITLSSVSEDLIRQVQIVLLNLGIVSGRTLKRGTYGGRPHVSQLLTINGAEADRFASLVGIGLERKRRLLRAAKRNTNIDVVPNVSGLLREAIGTARFARADHRLFQDYRVTRRRPSPAKLRQLVGVLEGGGASGPALDTLRLLGDGRQLFLSIVGIERSRADVYDLTVPETHSFVANGFVNHNTYLAVATAVKALQEREVSRIILTRPAVEAGERLGFLPGTLYEKIDPYLKPLYDALYEMMDADAFQRLMARGTVEVAPLAYMRGRTLNDSFIILDEAQNTSPEQMKMFLTRLGFGSKAVVNGDVTQIDLPAGQQSGLVVVEEILEDIEAIEFVHLGASDVVRHKIVQDIVEAYRRYGERTPKKAGEQR